MDFNSIKNAYVILRELGRGGMGTVFLAWDRRLERSVALKIISLPDPQDQQRQSRAEASSVLFLKEAKAIARLNHPHIITIYDLGGSEGRYFLVMEYVEGYNLEVMLQQMHGVPQELVLQIGIQLCDALDYAHRQGIVHRDIKPANVLLNAEGNIKLMDFGIAQIQQESRRYEESAEMAGSLLYMAPEQLVDQSQSDARSDLYSVGVTLYELLCGQKPYQDENIRKLITQIMTSEVPSLAGLGCQVSAECEAILVRALQKDPQDRFQSAAEMKQALIALSDPLASALLPAEAPAAANLSVLIPSGMKDYVNHLLNQAAASRQP